MFNSGDSDDSDGGQRYSDESDVDYGDGDSSNLD